MKDASQPLMLSGSRAIVLRALVALSCLALPCGAWAQDAPEPAAEEGAADKSAEARGAEGEGAEGEGGGEGQEADADAASEVAQGEGEAEGPKTPEAGDPNPQPTAPSGEGGGDASELEEFQKAYLRYEREILEYRREVSTIVRNEYQQRRAEIEAVYQKEIQGLEILERERRQEAILAFEEFLRKYPRNPVYTPDVLYRLAELYFEKSQDDFLLADERYETQRELYDLGRIPDPPETPARNYDKPIALFQRLITDFPDYRYLDGAYYLMGFCLSNTGQRDEAVAAFRDLIRLRPKSNYVPEAWVRIGEYHFDYNELEEAVSAYANALNYPDNTFYDKALYKLAWSYYRLDRFAEGIEVFKDLVRYADKKKSETGKSGSALREEAVQYLAISLSEEDWDNDGLPDANFGVARVNRYLNGGEPFESEVLKSLGDILFDNTRYEQAIEVYRLALSRYPLAEENPKIADKAIIALERLRRFDEAVEQRRQIGLNYGPGSEWYEHQRAEGRVEAMAFADKLAQDNLIDSATWYHEQAQKLAEEAISRSDSEMGRQAQERFRLAATAYEKYLEQYPNDRESYKWSFYLAECLFYSQQYPEAAEAYIEVRELNVGSNKFREQAAFNAIKALEFDIDMRIKRGELPPESLAQGSPEQGEGAEGKGGDRDQPKVVIEEREIPSEVERLNKERLRYVELGLTSPSDPYLHGKLEFESARVFYDFRHLDDARQRFEGIINRYEDQEVAVFAAMLIMESYVMVQDYENMAVWADKISKNPRLANNDRAKEIRAEASRLKLGAMFKSADALMDEGNYEEAAEAYIEIINEDPDNQYADKALNNAAVAYEKVKRYESAMKLYERVFRDYPDSPLAPMALYRVAFNAERFFDFDKAVRSYLLLVDRYNDSGDRENSLLRAAVIQENLQDYERAAATFVRFSNEYTGSEQALESAYQAVRIYEKMGDFNRQIRAFNDFRARFGNDPRSTPMVLEGLDKIATHYYKDRRDMRKARKAYQDVVNESISRGVTPGSVNARYPAKASFFMAEIDFVEWDKIQLRGKLKAQEQALKRKLEGAQKLRARYEAVYEYLSLEWTMAAGYRQANIKQRFATALYDADVPFPEDSEEYFMYKVQLEDIAVPLEDEAVEDYEAVIRQARQKRIVNEWTKKVLNELNKYKPAEFPLFHEEKTALTEETLTPLSPLTPAIINGRDVDVDEEEAGGGGSGGGDIDEDIDDGSSGDDFDDK